MQDAQPENATESNDNQQIETRKAEALRAAVDAADYHRTTKTGRYDAATRAAAESLRENDAYSDDRWLELDEHITNAIYGGSLGDLEHLAADIEPGEMVDDRPTVDDVVEMVKGEREAQTTTVHRRVSDDEWEEAHKEPPRGELVAGAVAGEHASLEHTTVSVHHETPDGVEAVRVAAVRVHRASGYTDVVIGRKEFHVMDASDRVSGAYDPSGLVADDEDEEDVEEVNGQLPDFSKASDFRDERGDER